MIEGGLTMPAQKHKHVASTPDRPLKQRKSVRLERIRGRLENSQGDTSQPVEINDSGDEKPSQLEGEENEKGLEGNEEGETEEEVEQPGQEEVEREQHEYRPLKNPLQEDELAKFWPIWVNMPNLSAHYASILKKNQKSILLRTRMHLKNYATGK